MTMPINPQDEAACSRLLVSASYFADLHRVDDFVALFAADGTVEARGHAAAGHDAIRAFMAGRPRDRRTRHVLSPPLIEGDGADAAYGTALFALFDGIAADADAVLPAMIPATVGEFHQTYRRVDGVWKVATHRSVAAFRRP